MSRRRKVYKKEERVDSRYGSPAVARLITTVMKRGKKSLAERIVYTAIEKSREGSDSVDPLAVLNQALENVRPRLEVKSRRVGGATYQVPLEVPPARQVSLARHWIEQDAGPRKGMQLVAEKRRRRLQNFRRDQTTDQHHRHAGSCGFHGGSGAFASRSRRCDRGFRRRRRRAAAVRNRLAAGDEIQCPAARIHQQDG